MKNLNSLIELVQMNTETQQSPDTATGNAGTGKTVVSPS